jgi:hypothetical protein
MEPTYSHFNWIEVAPNRWERATDEPEDFYHCIRKQWAGSGRMFFAMTGFVPVTVSILDGSSTVKTGERLDTALRHAWLSIRHDHPTIASWVEHNSTSKRFHKVYESCNSDSARQAWLDLTFKTVQTDLSGHEWANDDPPAPDLPTLFILASSSPKDQRADLVRRDIVLRSPHEIIDGIGTLQLLGNLLKKAAEAYAQSTTYTIPSFGSEHENLSPPFRVAAGIPSELSSTDKKRLDDILTENNQLQSVASLCVAPFTPGATVPGVHKRIFITLSETQTQRLLKTCKSASLTPTHAYHAAIALALRDLQPSKPPRDVRYISYSLINHRKDCAPPYNTAQHPVSVIHSTSGRSLALDMQVPAPTGLASVTTTEFGTLVTKVHAFYTTIAADKTHLARTPAFWARGTPSLPEEVLAADAPAPPIPEPDERPSVSISSMGRLDDIIAHQYGDISVEDPWITGEELRSGLGVFLGTWKGRLTLSAAYNDAWHDEKEVLGFLERCNDVVWKGLELDART